MAEDRKYFIFNKAMDYRRGQQQGLVFEDGALRPQGEAGGYFLSRPLDSREKETCWHRMKLLMKGG